MAKGKAPSAKAPSAKKKEEALTEAELEGLTELVTRSVALRDRLRVKSRFAASDEVRALLADVGVEVRDATTKKATNSSTRWRWRRKPALTQRKLGGGLVVKTLVAGTGAKATKGDTVEVKYVGALQHTGKTFDSGTIAFDLGDGDVIRGWDLGVQGMQRGEKRRLKVPPHLAYGTAGSLKGKTQIIPPNATLLFDVILKQIN